MKERDSSIDIAKGIGIFLVVLGHTTSNEMLLKWIYSFHMPLFFFLSGLFHSQGKNYKEFLMKKAKGLLVPYFSFAIILFFFFIIISKNIGFSAGENLSVKENFMGIFIGTDIANFSQVSWGGQLWFLLALFLVSNITYFLEKVNLKVQIILNIVFIFINIYLSKILNFYLPWCFLTVLISINFYWSGKKLKNYILNMEYKTTIWLYLFFVVNLLISNYNLKVDMWGNTYGNLTLFFIGAYSGIFFIIMFIKRFTFKYKILEDIGKNSLIILAFHRRVQTFTKVLAVFLLKILMPENNTIFDILYSTWQIVLCIPIIYILNKYFPYILGREKNG